MADRWTARRNTMAGIAPVTYNLRAAVVGERSLKTNSRMAETAVSVGVRVRRDGCHTCGHVTIVAKGATAGNTVMIKGAIQLEVEKTGGIVASIAFNSRRDVLHGFANGHYTVVADAAITENFHVIDKRDSAESEGGMTGLAGIAGSGVIRRFTPNRRKLVGMTIPAIG
jgi:hypothetical protein